ncbi:MAG: DUF296 domain-containing protein [Dehalococcoidia bacterium]|nr:DUF296 domain-containing protein [Dehalococcoidia bacterium]
MKSTEATVGRVFVLRLEDEDLIPDCIEQFAATQKVRAAHVLLLGGVGGGSVVCGPRDSVTMPPDVMRLPVEGAHETLAVGLLVPDETGVPRLHIHGALGRAGTTLSGCLRDGVTTWFMAEAVLTEIVSDSVSRQPDCHSGLSLLSFD